MTAGGCSRECHADAASSHDQRTESVPQRRRHVAQRRSRGRSVEAAAGLHQLLRRAVLPHRTRRRGHHRRMESASQLPAPADPHPMARAVLLHVPVRRCAARVPRDAEVCRGASALSDDREERRHPARARAVRTGHEHRHHLFQRADRLHRVRPARARLPVPCRPSRHRGRHPRRAAPASRPRAMG